MARKICIFKYVQSISFENLQFNVNLILRVCCSRVFNLITAYMLDYVVILLQHNLT